MRIVGGKWRGLRLAEVGKGDKVAHLRPTSDRVRESMFNLLTNGAFGDLVAGARVLDLFAGTGALGLEALSRGAAEVLFLDDGAAAGRMITANIAHCRAGGAARLMRRDATRPGSAPGAPFDLAFLDPPYGRGLGEKALAATAAGGWIAPGATVVWEENAEYPAPGGFERLDARRYGGTWVHVLRATA